MPKTIIITEEQYKRIFLQEQIPGINIPKQYNGKSITWRPEGYTQEDFNKENQKKKMSVANCRWEIGPSGGGCYVCPDGRRVCGNNPTDAINGPMGGTLNLKTLVPATGNKLSYDTVHKFNEAVKHKKKVSGLYGWSDVKDLIADEKFFASDGWVDKMKKLNPNILINPQYIATTYTFFYTQLKQDDETTKLISLWDKKKKQEEEKSALETQKKQDEIVSQGFDYYNQQQLQTLQNIPGLSSMDPQGAGGLGVQGTNIIIPKEIQNIGKIKIDKRQLSILEGKLQILENTINYINQHNDQIFSQTTEKFNKVGCDKTQTITTYYAPNGDEIEGINRNKYPYVKTNKVERNSVKGYCSLSGSKNGVWVSATTKSNVFSCDCIDGYASSQQHLSTNGSSYSANQISKGVDIRGGWGQFTDDFTYHDLLQVAAAVAFFIPGGVIASAALELVDGIGYFVEGDKVSGGIAIAFAALPAIGPLVRKIGVTGVKKIRKIITGAEKLGSDAEKMDFITKSYSKLNKIEQKALTKILGNPDVIEKEVKELSKLAKNNKPAFKKKLIDANPELEKHLHSWAKDSKYGEASAMEKVIYGGAVSATIGSDGEPTQTGNGGSLKDLKGNNKTIKEKPKKGDPYYDMDAFYIKKEKVNVEKYKSITNPTDDSKKNIEISTLNAIQKYKQSLMKK